MNLSELKQKPIGELLDIAKELENLARTRKQDVIFSILASRQERLGHLR